MTDPIVILSYARTPMGSFQGSLSAASAVDLGAAAVKAAVERAVEIAKAKGVRRAMMLPVSGPFHSALMQPAADVMAAALAKVTIKAPSVPLVANVLARPTSEPAEIVRSLVQQVTATVRWRESVAVMADAGVDTFYEVGAGRVLSGLVKRIAAGAAATAAASLLSSSTTTTRPVRAIDSASSS